MSQPAPRPLRAGDSDRSAVVDLLRAHHLDGRLTVEEFEERVEQTHRAVIVELHEDPRGGTAGSPTASGR